MNLKNTFKRLNNIEEASNSLYRSLTPESDKYSFVLSESKKTKKEK